jgi:hypothetical protein
MAAEDGMSQMFSRRVVAPESVLVRELSGQAVPLKLDSEMSFGLDEIGYRAWTLLTTSDSIGVAYEQLLSEFRACNAANHLRGGPDCLNRFSASISGASARVRLPSGVAAG